MASKEPTPAKRLKLSTEGPGSSTSNEEKEKLCEICLGKNERVKAEFSCETCDGCLMCKGCKIKHEEQKTTRYHTVNQIKAYQGNEHLLLCEKHGRRSRKFLCLKCDETICVVCRDLQHGDHELENLEGIGKDIAEAVESLVSSDDIDEEVEAIKISKDQLISKVKEHVENVQKDVRKKGDELVYEISRFAADSTNAAKLGKFRGDLNEILRRGEEVVSSKLETGGQYRDAKKTKEDLEKSKENNVKLVEGLKSQRMSFDAATFISREIGGIGEFLPGPPGTAVEHFHMKYSGSCSFPNCSNIGKVAYLPNGFAVLCSSNCQNKMDSVRIYTIGKPVKRFAQSAVNMFTTDEHIEVLQSNGSISTLSVDDIDDKTFSQKTLITAVHDIRFHAPARNGKYIVVGGESIVYILSNSFRTITIGPLIMRTRSSSGEKYWLKNYDMLLVRDNDNCTVHSCTLEVYNTFDAKSGIKVTHFMQEQPSFSSPLSGFYIMDMCSTDDQVLLCLKRGDPAVRDLLPGPVKIYAAKYSSFYKRWEMTSIRLVKEDGKELCFLEKDEQMKIAAAGDRFLCLVSRPDQFLQFYDKHTTEARMNITCYMKKGLDEPSPGTSQASGCKKVTGTKPKGGPSTGK